MDSKSDGPTESRSIFTYHHICSQFVLASTHVLASLPRRAPPALDQAIILPLGSTSEISNATHLNSDDEDVNMTKSGTESLGEPEDYGYSVLLSAAYDKKQVIIRRDDGFEKRLHFRCGRCKVVLGYELDKTHFGQEVDQEQTGKIVYLLPDALMTTEEMEKGKRFTQQEVVVGRA